MATWWIYPHVADRYLCTAYIPLVLGGVHALTELRGSTFARSRAQRVVLVLLLLIFAGNAIRKQARWRSETRVQRAQARAVEVLESRRTSRPLVYRFRRDIGVPWRTEVEILALRERIFEVRAPLPGQVPETGCWVLSQFPPEDPVFEDVTPASDRLIDRLSRLLFPNARFGGSFYLYEIAR